jgi:hypothetical protein
MRCDMRPEAQVDWFVRHFLNRKNAIRELLGCHFQGLPRRIEISDDLAVAHERELIAMSFEDAAQLSHKRVVVPIDLPILKLSIHVLPLPAEGITD